MELFWFSEHLLFTEVWCFTLPLACTQFDCEILSFKNTVLTLGILNYMA